MIDLDLARQFLLDYLPQEKGKVVTPLNEYFDAIKTEPDRILGNCLLWNRTFVFPDTDPRRTLICANGVLTGFALALHLSTAAGKERIQSCIEAAKKERGENVVSFLEKKGKR